MLILYRKNGERIYIGTESQIEDGTAIVVTCMAAGKSGFKIGVDAPDDVLILREELLKRHEEVAS
jgi:carbon storage regulator CsrA